ncbi:hypothetical protein ACQ4PT_054398 [Festuca glaucescens]
MSRTLQLLLVLLLEVIVRADAASRARKNIANGPHSCGGVDIPYPFGTHDDNGEGDFREGFHVRCDTGGPVLATTGDEIPIPIGNFSIETAQAIVRLPVGRQCYDSSGNPNESEYMTLKFNTDGVYRISHERNYLFVLGYNTVGFLGSQPDDKNTYAQFTGCLCYCNNSLSAVSGACSGVGCCHNDVPLDLVDNAVFFDSYNHSHKLDFSPCDYAFLAEKDHYTFNTTDLKRSLGDGRNPGRCRWWSTGLSGTASRARRRKRRTSTSRKMLIYTGSRGPFAPVSQPV